METLTALDLITAIHGQNPKTRIHFCSKTKGKWNELASIPTEEIAQLFPRVEPYLKKEGYFSLNGFSMPSKRNSPKTGLPKPAEKKANLQVLNGMWADVDTGRRAPINEPRTESRADRQKRLAKQQDTQDAMCQTLDKLTKRGIPHPTFWSESGQGFYLVWLFEESLRAWPETIDRLENAQRSLRCIHPAFDCACTNANRVLRVPGTIHGTTEKRALWRPDVTGPNRYEAEELWARLGIDGDRVKRYTLTQNPGTCPQRSAGRLALFGNYERELLALHHHRGGFVEGTRRYALTVLAVAKMNLRQSPVEIQQALQVIAGQCQPPFPSHDNDRTIAQIGRDARGIKNEHRTAKAVIERLGISQAEATTLGFKTLNPKLNETRNTQSAKRLQNTGRPQREARRALVERFLAANSDATNGEILAAAKAANIKAALSSIRRDRAALTK